jgi:hypothetical protein
MPEQEVKIPVKKKVPWNKGLKKNGSKKIVASPGNNGCGVMKLIGYIAGGALLIGGGIYIGKTMNNSDAQQAPASDTAEFA